MKRYEIQAREIRQGDIVKRQGKSFTLDWVKHVNPPNERSFVWAADDFGFSNNSPVVCVGSEETVEVWRDD